MQPIKNVGFFKQKASSDNTTEKINTTEEKVQESRKPLKKQDVSVCISPDVINNLKTIQNVFVQNGMESAAKKIEAIFKQVKRDKFSVAVVGEFSRGKSTFINKMLEKEFLPVADLPTTAMMTRISYNPNDVMVLVNEKGAKVKTMPAKVSSWEGLTADNFTDNDPRGVVYAGIDNEWLAQSGVEIIDTPGAGDLEEKRARVIGDALMGCDGAIITISALAALSMSEKLFIEQRLISRKTPFLMLIITKLDLVPYNERADVVGYIKQKLSSWGMDIPVYIPYDIDLPVETYDNIIGIDKVKDAIAGWVNNPKRAKLTSEWLFARATQTINSEIDALNEQLLILQADDDKREELIKDKKRLLSKAKIAWEDLRLQLLERGTDCYKLFVEKINESKASITERLQYEASHSNNLSKWWRDDYPYRLKIELSNLSSNVENLVSRKISDDARWFNTMLEQQFKSHVLFESERVTDKTFFDPGSINTIEFEDLDKKRQIVRVGTTVLSLAGAALCAAAGGMTLVATMGVSTGSSIISEKVFNGKIEKQRQIVKGAIAENVPNMIDSSISDSEMRLKAIYDDIIKSAVEKEQEWLAAQYTVIENSVKPKNTQQEEKIKALIDTLRGYVK